MESFVVGVLALQGGFLEHISMLQKAAERLSSAALAGSSRSHLKFEFIEVRNKEDLSRCHALVIPGGESTSISFVAAQIGLLEPLRDFVKYCNPLIAPSQFDLARLSNKTFAAQGRQKAGVGNLRGNSSARGRGRRYQEGWPGAYRWSGSACPSERVRQADQQLRGGSGFAFLGRDREFPETPGTVPGYLHSGPCG